MTNIRTRIYQSCIFSVDLKVEFTEPPTNKSEIDFLKSETDLGVFSMILLVNLIGIINLHIAYHKKYKEINEFMDFFADTDLPPISEGEGKKFKMRTYLGFASRQVKMQILTVTMGYLCTQGYWSKVQGFCGQMQPPLDCDDYYYLVLFLCCLSVSFIFAAPIHIGKFFLCLIFT